MKTTATGAGLLLVALACHAAEPPAQSMTWQEANKRSAALLKEDPRSTAGADLARMAFDQYPLQVQAYHAKAHAQLLLNLVHARRVAGTSRDAREELERGIGIVVQRVGPKDPVLIDLWRQGSAIDTDDDERGRYFNQAMSVADQAWGPDDPRTIKLALSMAHDRRQQEGYAWAKSKFQAARARAARAGEDSALVAEADLLLAKLEMERGHEDAAIEGFKALVERLEARPGREQDDTLALAYGLLALTYEREGNLKAGAELRQRTLERWGRPYPVKPGAVSRDDLLPLVRVTPEYPRDAAMRGWQGFVELQVDVNPDGTVADLKVLRSEPRGVFDEATLRAVRKWKFQPKVVDGKPVPSSGTQLIEYRLEDGPYSFRRGSD